MFLFLLLISQTEALSAIVLATASSDEGLTLETSAFESLYGGQLTLIKPIYPVLQREGMIFLSLSIVTGSISRGDECTLGSTDQDEVTGPCSSAEGRVCCQKPDTYQEKEDFQTEVINFVPFSLFFVACLLCSIFNADCICICASLTHLRRTSPASGSIHSTQKKFEYPALFLPSTLIRHQNGAFQKCSSNRRNLKTPAFRFRSNGRSFSTTMTSQ